MKNAVHWIVMFIIGSLIFSNCSKRTNQDTPSTPSHALPGNAFNPYDRFGFWHNLILDSIDRERSVADAYSFNRSCGAIRKFYRLRRWNNLNEEHFNGIPQVVDDAALQMPELIRRSPWSDSVKTNLIKLVHLIKAATDDTCDYPKLKQSVAQFEAGILQSELSAPDQEVLLKVASIARHSGYRWMLHPGGSDSFNAMQLQALHQRHGFRNVMMRSRDTVSTPGPFEKVGKWFVVTLCDMGGAITDLSVASGAAASDYMSKIFSIH